MLNPTVLTAGQEREQRGGFVLGSSWNGKGTHMWRLKQEKPELFERQEKALVERLADQSSDRPPGFEPYPKMEGWLYNKEKNIFFEEATGQRFWFDEVGKVHRPLREGESRPVTFVGGAAAVPSASSTPESERKPAPKHIIISDLHGAAKALKMDFAHLDRPAGALAVVGLDTAGGAANSASLDIAARALPEKLLRRLAAFRGEWSDDMLGGAIASAFADVAVGLSAAVALVAGQRIVAAATPGTRFSIATQPVAGSAECMPGAAIAPSPGQPTATRCRKLADNATEAILVCLTVGEVGANGENVATTASYLSQGRPRAASIALLKSARANGAHGPLAVASARLSLRHDLPTSQSDSIATSSSTAIATPPAKRHKSEEKSGKIRLRQILLRHSSAPRPVDPVRGKPVKRSLEEAEDQILGVLDGLVADGCASFPSTCKAISECQSALKGGEFAGDLGWLDRSADVQKQAGKAVRVQVPTNVLKVAFELAVGELGDIVTSDLGVHLIQRTA